MKRFLLFAAVALLTISCNSDIDDPQIPDNSKPEKEAIAPVTIKATLGFGTKVENTLENNAFSSVWHSGDELLVEFDGQVNTLALMNGSYTKTATFAGSIKGKPEESSILVCRTKMASASILNQDGTLEGAMSAVAFSGTAAYGSGKDIACKLVSNVSILKLSLRDSDAEAKGAAGTFSYYNGSEELASTSFVADENGNATVYIAVPAGSVSGGHTAEYKVGDKKITVALADKLSSLEAGKVQEASFYLGAPIDISKITGYFVVPDGATIFGKGGQNIHLAVEDGSSITLDGVTITDIPNDLNHIWPGITCLGDATVALKGVNALKGGHFNEPGITAPVGKTLTIQGDGQLTAGNNGRGPAIGASFKGSCGNIVIKGGTIVATGGALSAGIGGGCEAVCGDITITGGDVTAVGGSCGAGIGTGDDGRCGNITITNTVTKVTATRGSYAKSCIGRGYPDPNHPNTCYCGTVTIGGTVYGSDGVTEASFTYKP